jgi:hypothetical protein
MITGRYRAFLSYSRAADDRLAPSLQAALQQFSKPWYRFKSLSIFRDQANLSVNPSLWDAITRALDQSDYFILLASPEAAASQWVGREVQYWNSKAGTDSILLVLTDGHLDWDTGRSAFNREKTDALPDVLLDAYSKEPLFLDLRWAKNSEQLSLAHPRYRDAVADIAATLHDKPKDELIGEEIRQHRRTRRLAWSAVTALIALTLFSAGSAWIALEKQQLADERRIEAERQSRVSQAGRLAAESSVLRADEPTDLALSVLLAIESLRRHASPQAERALRAGLKLLPQPLGGFQHYESIYALAFSPDGAFFATAADDDTARIWDTETQQEVVRLQHGAGVNTIAFSPDGGTLLSGSYDVTARLWEVPSGREILRQTHASSVYAVAFHPDGTAVASGDNTGNVKIWGLSSGDEGARMLHADDVAAVRSGWAVIRHRHGAKC